MFDVCFVYISANAQQLEFIKESLPRAPCLKTAKYDSRPLAKSGSMRTVSATVERAESDRVTSLLGRPGVFKTVSDIRTPEFWFNLQEINSFWEGISQFWESVQMNAYDYLRCLEAFYI